MKRTSGGRKRLFLPVMGFFHILCLTASAQQWQYVYGEDQTQQNGAKRVVVSAAGGYVAVGTTYYPGNNPAGDVYVVRTDKWGAKVWEYTYDVQNNGSTDIGHSIVELGDGSGLVVTGSSESGGHTDAFLMKIDPSGAVVWTETYQGPTVGSVYRYSIGYDVIEAQTGNGTTTNPGDLVVAGTIIAENQDALIFRTNSTGTLIWKSVYDNTQGIRENETLMGLIEVTPLGIGTLTSGDIVAVGTHISSTDPSARDHNGLIMRVTGTTGSLNYGGPLQQGIATYGFGTFFLPTNDVFLSLVELENPSEIGSAGLPNVVVVGFGVNHSGGAPIGGVSNYLVKLDNGNPCTPLIEAYIGDDDAHDEGADIREITFPIDGSNPVQQWDLVIAGKSNGPSSTGSMDAHMLGIDPAALTPLAGSGNVYRPTSGSNLSDHAWSLGIIDGSDPVGVGTAGFIMCGTTISDWLGVGDPQDMYLVKTDLTLSSGGCEQSYSPVRRTNQTKVCLNVTIGHFLDQETETTVKTSRDWGDEVCTGPGSGGKRVPSLANEAGTPASHPSTYTVGTAPNPVRAGESITLLFNGDAVPESVEISVADALGQRMGETISAQLDAGGTLVVDSEDWAPGTYFITIDDGNYTRTVRVVLID